MKNLFFSLSLILATLSGFAQPCSISLIQSTPACGISNCTGSVSIQVEGTGNINISWSDGLGNGTDVYGLCGDSYYTVDIIDDNSCEASETFYIDFAPQSTINVTIENEQCFEACDGSITVDIIGSNGPYQSVWSNYTDTYEGTSLTNLCSSSYYGVVTDGSGCETVFNEYIDSPMPVMIDMLVTEAECSSGGSINLEVGQGGMAKAFTFLWSNGATTEDIYNLIPGYYTVTITEGSCTYIQTEYVSLSYYNSPQLSLGETHNVTCFATNNDNGYIEVIAEGTPQYFYIWSNGATTSYIDNLTPGFYTVTVTDSEGGSSSCANVIGYEVLPFDLTINLNGYNPSCPSGGNGSIYTNVQGGEMPYAYTWNDDQLNEVSTSDYMDYVSYGVYFLTVTDANGCSITGNYTLLPDGSPSTSIETTAYSCFGQTNVAAASVTTNSPYPPFYYNWSNGQQFWGVTSNTTEITGLAPGIYSVTISDSNPCSSCCGESYAWIEIVEEPEFTIDNFSLNQSCFGLDTASLTINASGGVPPYFHSLDGTIWNSGTDLDNLSPDTYDIYIKDTHDCILTSGDIIVEEYPELTLTITPTPADCGEPASGTASIVTNAPQPATYLWSNGVTTENADTLIADTYSVTITDANHCTITGNTVIGQLTTASISGFANSTLGPLADASGTVKLFKQVPEVTQLIPVGTSIISSGGVFNFSGLSSGEYAIRLIPNTTIYPLFLKTWYESVVGWENATMLNIACEDVVTGIQLDVLELPAQTGQGSFSGYIYYWDAAKGDKELGEPVIGAEVFVEQEPNDQPVANGGTDNNGYYEIDNLQENEVYNVYVEIPGLPLLSTYSGIPVSPGMSDYENMNYFVDTTNVIGGIFIDTILTVNQSDLYGFSFQLYPNPVKDHVNIKFNAKGNGTFNWELFDATGRLVSFSETLKYSEGRQTYAIDIAETGIYYLNCRVNNMSFIKKIVRE
ncbi:MAG: hypothetical protein CVU05_03375 [Bacteroidetes bacterium HGW-Bacteroidetes-21]|nr:MAG: hypothetical protein CVU05_03375 [Bacteroidetes bacterium HGW-Bacteroidetes-21]